MTSDMTSDRGLAASVHPSSALALVQGVTGWDQGDVVAGEDDTKLDM